VQFKNVRCVTGGEGDAFAFWPTSPVVSQTLLIFSTSLGEGRWHLAFSEGMAMRVGSFPAIGRQPSCGLPLAAEDPFEDFVVIANALFDADGFTKLKAGGCASSWLPTRLLDWSANPLLAAWFAIEEESLASDAKSGPSVPFRAARENRLKFWFAGTLRCCEVSACARLTAQERLLSLHPDPQSPWQPSPPLTTLRHFGSSFEKAEFRRLLHNIRL